MKKVIAVDGPSGAGKSTVAKMLAKELGFDYLDTGALYRAVAYYLVKHGIQEEASDAAVTAALRDVKIRFSGGMVTVNGADVSHEIRSPEASHFASVFSARKPVRQFLFEIQRDTARHADIVAEGRDMTTVVFPDAYKKFYLDASVEERTRRRTLELQAKGFEVNEEKTNLEIMERDARDAGRDIAPLKRAQDAVYIDSTGNDIMDVFRKMLEAVNAGGVAGREKGMKIVVARRAGFCFGVKRAIDIALDISEKDKEGVYTLGPIIHNPQVIQQLKNRGVAPVETGEIDDAAVKTLIIRTHGIPCDLYDNISSRGFRIVDATCPFVKKAQDFARLLAENGYQVVILGDKDHPEVKGLVSFAGSDVMVVGGAGPLSGLKSKVGVVVQTTQPVDALKRLLSAIVEQAREVKVYNTICNSTALRLKETEEMAGRVDVMVVVGGKNSANTTQLANLCCSRGVRTFHVETAQEIEAVWFDGIDTVGITAGASTPDWIIVDVENRIKEIGGISPDGTY